MIQLTYEHDGATMLTAVITQESGGWIAWCSLCDEYRSSKVINSAAAAIREHYRDGHRFQFGLRIAGPRVAGRRIQGGG